ncbi:histidine kinase [Teredinibacter franksiae]|jgi:hypothetical protein|uniref:histidine kinase n=1 Tax=Teredinibacter franksiae TaxID=2761453 RepID=UPI001628E1CC|nr:histidine kinase [Teredinibacter franksiae]
MNYFAKFVFVALLSNSVVAGEVGALDPESSSVASAYDVALAEIGTSDRWDTQFDNFRVVPVESASSRQMELLNQHLNTINAEINAKMNALIEEKVASSLSK